MDLQDYFLNKDVLIVLDVSGSMDESYIPVLETLQKLSNRSNMSILPFDSQYHWKEMIRLDANLNLGMFSGVGRGGSIIDDGLKNYHLYLPQQNTILFVTDGWIMTEDLSLKEDVLWTVTQGNNFKPRYGQLIDYRKILKKMMFYSV